MNACCELARIWQRRSRDARVVVLAAHPDDETLGAASLLLDAARCVVVHLTDGAPHDRGLWPHEQFGDRERYAHTRRAETIAALRRARLTPDQILCLGCPDQAASLHLAALSHGFARMLERLAPSLVVAHAYEGGHPDHDAAAFVAAHALRLLAVSSRARPGLIEMACYHGAAGQLTTGEFLARSQSDLWTRDLTHRQRTLKRDMLASYVSQRGVIAAFGLEREQFRSAPDYDFVEPPHAGLLYYEQLGWLHGEQWRRLARTAQGALGLTSGRRSGAMTCH